MRRIAKLKGAAVDIFFKKQVLFISKAAACSHDQAAFASDVFNSLALVRMVFTKEQLYDTLEHARCAACNVELGRRLCEASISYLFRNGT